jgi:3-oxoacyl-[acyl-carrier-protein] synthase-3
LLWGFSVFVYDQVGPGTGERLYAHIVGWGKYIPERVITNDDIAQFMDTSDEWIRTRTGIRERRFAAEHETTATMSVEATKLALDRARIVPGVIDLIIVATLTPEHIFPSTASLVQDAIGAKNAGAFDLSAACSGFIYALSMGSAAIRAGSAKVVVVIGAETLSRVLDDQDRSTYPLFGDGAGAVVLQAHPVPGGVLACELGSDGSGGEHLIIPAGGSKLPPSQRTVDERLHFVKMNGREVYRFATRIMGKAARQACNNAGVNVSDIDLFVPHQANIRIIQSASKALGITDDKVFTNLDRYGNTSAASVPIALCEAIEQGRVNTHDRIVMVGFGGGLSWGAAVVQWGLPMPYKRRQWWYRALRWMLYRWIQASSNARRWQHRVSTRLNEDLDGYMPLETEEQVKKPKSPTPPPTDNGRSPNGTLPDEQNEDIQVEEEKTATPEG